MSGTLFIVATPIGNLEDITYRAVTTLREADVIACEDTRHTRTLLERYGVTKPLVSYHDHNERERARELLAEMEAGRNVALVSDAGTPLMADPGYRLVHAAIERGIRVSPVPGPTAAPAALSASGLGVDAFVFAGFLAAKATQRRRELERWRDTAATLIFYEAPHRILEALEDISAVYGERPVVVAREMTKVHEEFLRGTAEQVRAVLAGRPSVKGEFVILVGWAEQAAATEETIEEEVARREAAGTPRMEAIKQAAKARGMGKREAYRALAGAGRAGRCGAGQQSGGQTSG
jgi:16S rRNA (cytidine1402-2'-O)-methyltransferase